MSALFLCGCGQSPRIDVTARIEDGEVVFDIPHTGINGLLRFIVKDEEGKSLWSVDLTYETGHKIMYGEVPKGGKQQLPADGTRPPRIGGRAVVVIVKYQYDDQVPSADSFSKTIHIP
jgi:hypothetical protein